MNGHGLDNEDLRRELADYYKWIVGLATFVLTTSGSLVALFGENLEFKWVFAVGWSLLVLCVFLNWLIVKRLVTIPVVRAQPEENKTALHRVFEGTGCLLKAYGLFQNWSFLFGTAAVLVALALNWF